MDHDHFHHDSAPANFWGSRASIGLIVLGAVAAYFLLTEHRAHLFTALPYLLLAACPFMHMFMHGGHSGHSHGQDPAAGDRPQAPPPPTTGDAGVWL
jgi:hypothetical protein